MADLTSRLDFLEYQRRLQFYGERIATLGATPRTEWTVETFHEIRECAERVQKMTDGRMPINSL